MFPSLDEYIDSVLLENAELKSKVQELTEQIYNMTIEIERRKQCYECADDCDRCPLNIYLKPIIET